MINRHTKVETIFNTRITNICRAANINELGDFENNSVYVLKHVTAGNVGVGTIQSIRDILKRAGIMTIEDRIDDLVEYRELVIEYTVGRKLNKPVEWINTVKLRLAELNKRMENAA